ncbi:hypothetical protein [uncultured Sphingomonas sp.]|uniref:hypothetical protein n=1 Tax=uncultured Sphingomonas sp. TaxID=158754 RepID=UPI0026302BDE|nr:hypothetical protein [uncultured Sphingomonas sp.]
MSQTNEQGETFGEWLLAQKADCRMADLVNAAKGDRMFPRRGSPDDVRKRLNEMQADGDMRAVVDEAETDWLSY